MPENRADCGIGSVWAPPLHRLDCDPDTPVSTVEDRRWHAWFQVAAVLVAHGVAPQDVNLLMPDQRRFATAFAAQLDREHDAALAHDPAVCSVGWRACPEHGATLYRDTPRMRSPRTRCRVRGCRLRLNADALIRHCDQPATACAIELETALPHRMCTAHADLARDAGLLVIGLDDTDQDDDTADTDQAA